jgi:replicative DNA helicase
MNAEQAVIGSVLLSNGRALDTLTLKPEDFPSVIGEQIYRKAQELHRAGTGIDVITLSAALPHLTIQLHDAMTSTPTASNVEYYADLVAEGALRRRLTAAAVTVQAQASDIDKKLIPDEVRKVVDDALGSVTGSVSFMGDEIENTIASLGEKAQFVESPWRNLNTIIGGFRPGALYLVAARPGVGKTVIGLQLALHLAQQGSVAFSSLEMSRQELHKRVIAQTFNIHMAELSGQDPLSKLSANQINRDFQKLNIPLAIDDRAGVSVYDIRGFARSVHHRNPLAAVVVDYVGLIQDHSGKDKSRYETVTFISQQLKVLARDLNVPVIALAQLNREVENRKEQKPMLSDLRDSGSLEQDADVVILLRRDLAGDRNKISLDVAKNRHGETKTFDLGFQGEYSRATNHEIRK